MVRWTMTSPDCRGGVAADGVSCGECNGDTRGDTKKGSGLFNIFAYAEMLNRPGPFVEIVHTGGMTPPPDEVRTQLERVLATEAFVNAGRLSRLLRYLVDRTLTGEGDQLKEYVLGVEVFDRPGAYDPRLDSIVRVEMRRLRSKLEEYYHGPGATDPLVISIPRGSYVPRFTTPDTGHGTPHPAPAAGTWHRAPGTLSGRLALAACVAGVLTLFIFAATRSRPDPSTTAQASSGPSIAVLPFQHYSTSAGDAMLAARITDLVTTELAQLGTVSVASRTSASQYTGEARPVREIAKALRVDYVMEASAIVQGSGIHVEARLVDGELDRKVWVGRYDSRSEDIPDLARRIAAEASAGLVKLSSHPQQ